MGHLVINRIFSFWKDNITFLKHCFLVAKLLFLQFITLKSQYTILAMLVPNAALPGWTSEKEGSRPFTGKRGGPSKEDMKAWTYYYKYNDADTLTIVPKYQQKQQKSRP